LTEIRAGAITRSDGEIAIVSRSNPTSDEIVMTVEASKSLEDLTAVRTQAIAEFRTAFHLHGFDVSGYTDDEISYAVLDGMQQSLPAHDHLASVFERMRLTRSPTR
jgi:hypothetical protein